MNSLLTTRRQFLAGSAALAASAACGRFSRADDKEKVAQICVTLDLEMSAEYPKRGMTEWNFRKGDLDDATKKYSLKAAELVKSYGGVLHFFCVGQVLEHPSVEWLKELAAAGHPIGNHTYDHVYVKANKPEELQFRFRRAPWLIEGKSVSDVIRENIAITNKALFSSAGIKVNGFRTPGGFQEGLADRPDVQQMLLDLGFTWVSSKYVGHKIGKPKEEPTDEVYAAIRDAQKESQPFVYPTGLVEIPMNPISDVGAFRANYWKREWFLKALRESVTWAIETGSMFDLMAHPSCLVMEDPELESIRLMCELAKAAGPRAKLVGLDEVAKTVKK